MPPSSISKVILVLSSFRCVNWFLRFFPMFHAIVEFFRKRDDGQDLSEYCLITALIALIALGIFIHVSGGVQNLWSGAQTSLGNAAGASTTTGSGQGSQPVR
jgi:Flp pilus assembly pilin Flp